MTTQQKTVMLTFNVLIEIPDEERIDIFDRPIPEYNTVFDAVDSALGNLPNHLGWISSKYSCTKS